MAETRLESFQQAYRNLQLQPLAREELDQFGVDYGAEVMQELAQLMEDSPSGNSKIIFTGHRSSGKSTLLAQLSRKLESRYFVVLFSIAEMIEMSDVNHLNILFAIAVRLMEEAEQKAVTISSTTKKAFYQWFATRTKLETKEKKREFSFGADFFKLIRTRLKTDSNIREEIKQEFSPKVSDLISTIDDIAAVVEGASGQEILVIIDDLDKLDLAVVRDIYQAHIKALFQPNFRIILTIPISALREIPLLSTLEGETNDSIVSMTVPKLFPKKEARQPNAVPFAETTSILREILSKRISSDLLEPETADQIILYSGGVLGELIRITNQCCRVCLRLVRRDGDEEIRINEAVFKEVIKKLRLNLDTRFGLVDYEMLEEIYREFKPKDLKDPRFLDLLHGLHALEYRNDDLWYDVHPLVRELLARKGKI